MLAPHSSLRMVPHRGATTTASVEGVLDSTTYARVRDGLLGLAAESSDCFLADIAGLEIPDRALVRVFGLVARRVGDWPAIPFALVTGRADQRAMLAACPAEVPVYADAGTAEAALTRPARSRAGRVLARSPHTSVHARRFVLETCTRWRVPELAEDAELVATEFVENVLLHTDSAPWLRLELRRGTLTVEVADGSPDPAVLRERLDPVESGLGLRLVAGVAKLWGSSGSWSGGKTVWAVLAR